MKHVEHSASSAEWNLKPVFSNVPCRNQLGKTLRLGSAWFRGV